MSKRDLTINKVANKCHKYKALRLTPFLDVNRGLLVQLPLPSFLTFFPILTMAGRPSTVAEIRRLPVIPGRKFQAGATLPLHDETLNTASRSIAQAAHIRGILMPQPCNHCSSGRKKMFAECITLPGYMAGRCSNCHFAMDGRQCSLAPSLSRRRPRSSATQQSDTIHTHLQDNNPRVQPSRSNARGVAGSPSNPTPKV